MEDLRSRMGRICAVIGAQWGDEGKGKIVDLLAEQYDVIARSSGGANAGHTIVVRGEKRVFHLIPSGCLHEGKTLILGSGMVIHLPTLLEEIRLLKAAGVDVMPRLHISYAAHIVFEYHKQIDAALEERRSKTRGQGIGTTRRGIGPAYRDKAARTGLRMENLLSGSMTEELQRRTREIEECDGITVNFEEEHSRIVEARDMLKGCIADTVDLLLSLVREGKSVLIEGAQGALLDIDHGTYPFVTSGSTTAAGALQGLVLPHLTL